MSEPTLYAAGVERQREVSQWAIDGGGELGPEFWNLLQREWSGFDAIDYDVYQYLFGLFRPFWSPPANAFYNSLPSRFVVYRGGDLSEDHDLRGLSWTVSRKVARSFARGHRGLWNAEPTLFSAIIDRDEVALAIDNRNEAEVVLFEVPSPYRIIACGEGTRGFKI